MKLKIFAFSFALLAAASLPPPAVAETEDASFCASSGGAAFACGVVAVWATWQLLKLSEPSTGGGSEGSRREFPLHDNPQTSNRDPHKPDGCFWGDRLLGTCH